MTIAVKSVDNIGHLVDKILSKDGVTLNGFNWKASKVIIKIFSKIKWVHKLLRKVCNKDKSSVDNLD
jgi:hypothetical protein